MPTTIAHYHIGGIAAPDSSGSLIDLGPTHPTSAGLLGLSVESQGERIVAIDAQPGHLHRGAELIASTRDYRQALSLTNRHDWQAPFFGEWALARAVEDALGVDVPARARWIRAIWAEHQRIGSHLAHLSFITHHLRRPDLGTDAIREQLRLRTAELSGNRVHPMVVRLGGIATDVSPAWADAERATAEAAASLASRIDAAISGTIGVGIAPVTPADINAHGLAGPIARASGVHTDLRREASPHAEPWSTLSDLLEVDAPTDGDAQARFRHLAAEISASAHQIDRLLDTLPSGPLRAHLPKVIKLPEGDWTASVEAPLGRAGIVVTSRGEKTPWRLRLRTASGANVSAWSTVIPGTHVDDLAVAVASLPWVAGDLDK